MTHRSDSSRCAVSTRASRSTIHAEGSKRQGRRDYARFLNIAEGSLGETQYLLMLARDLGDLPQGVAAPLLDEVDEIARMLHALRVKVEPGDDAP